MEEQMVEQRDDGRNEMQQAVYDKLTKTIKNVKGVPTEVPESTAANFLTVFREDTEFAGVKYNEMAHRLMTEDDDGIREWTAVDDATSRRYIEQFYRLTGQQKWQDALIEFQKDRAYQPIQEKINALKWDGKARVETFLIDWLKVEDTPYNREASRLLFAGESTELTMLAASSTVFSSLSENRDAGSLPSAKSLRWIRDTITLSRLWMVRRDTKRYKACGCAS